MTIDKIQVQQVLINIIRNSIEAMKNSSTRNLSITTAEAGPNTVICSIADTGPGLAPEVASRLFQPFVTTKEKGMGIGLSICQSIVEAHGGQISAVARSPEPGALFRCRFPTRVGA